MSDRINFEGFFMITMAELKKKLDENKRRMPEEVIKEPGILNKYSCISESLFPTTRHDATGDGFDLRVYATAMYFLGGLSPAQFEMVGRNVIRFHDHKGILHAVVRAPLSKDIIERLIRCWFEVGAEESVEVYMEDDSYWHRVWSFRRFDTN